MVQLRKKDRKLLYFKKFNKILQDNERCFIVGVDNVRSKQMQQIRFSLRGSAEMVMGKNTMMKKALRDFLERDERVEKLLPYIKENVGFVFTKGDLSEVREKILSNRVAAPAKAGVVAQCDVTIQPQQTTLNPEKTSFFQALSIPTKITKGTIEILSSVPIIREGTRVGASEATLLTMLNITPFAYGLEIKQVYDAGSVFPPAVLDVKADDIATAMKTAARSVAALSMALDYPTMAAVPHALATQFKKMLALSVATDYTFKESAKMKEYLADPSKFAVVAPVVAAKAAAPAAKKEEKKPEPESESDEDIGMGLFG